jgi:hypothetical protein
MIRLTLILLLTLTTTTGLMANRQRPATAQQPEAASTAPAPLMQCLALLDLTEAQQLEIRRILNASAPRITQLRAEHSMAVRAFRNATGAHDPEPCAIGAAYLRVEATKQALQAEIEQIVRQIGTILTLEQRDRLRGCLDGLRSVEPRP